jgi:putative NADH-flavin reductase
MSIAVFGASGATGQRFIAAATAAGHPLRLHYRTAPETEAPPYATVVVGSLADPTAVRETLRGVSAVVVLFGPRRGSKDVFCAKATRAIIEGMRSQGQTRLLCQTGAMIGELPANVSIGMKMMSKAWRKFVSEEQADDRDAQERVVRRSNLDWTLVKPPRLTDDVGTETVQTGVQLDVGLRSHVSRDSVAQFLLQEIVAPRYIQQAVYLAAAAGARAAA